MVQDIWEVVKSSRNLPTLPTVAMKVVSLSQNPDVSTKELADVISNDPALASKILRIVNSAYYGFASQVSTLTRAVALLGLVPLKFLVLSFTLVKDLHATRHKEGVFDYIQYWRSSLTTAVASRLLAKKVGFRQTEEAFLAGLLEDIGMLVLATCMPRAYEKVLAVRRKYEIPLADAEERTFGTDHAEIGGKLVESWGLPDVLFLPIRFHHEPTMLKDVSADVATLTNLLNVADMVARMFCEEQGERLVALVKGRAEQNLHIGGGDTEEVLQGVASEVRGTADMFELDIGGYKDYAEVLEKANVSLGELGVISATQAAGVDKNLRRDPGELPAILTAEISRAATFARPLGVLLLAPDNMADIDARPDDETRSNFVDELAQVVLDTVRTTDTVVLGTQPGAITVSLPGCRDEALKGTADRIRHAVAEHAFPIGDQNLTITVCVAAVCYCRFDRNPSAQQLVNAAEKVLEQARRRGPNTALFARV